MLHSIYDLTTYCRKTTGDVPAKLVGASTTVVGSKMYLFGGRLVTERRMVSDLYVFDLESFVWEKVYIHPEDDVPQARYFHSADTWGNQLIIFGGMSNQPESLNPEELCVLNDVRIFDISSGHWLPSPPPHPASDPLVPRARYAHLSSVTSNRLFIIGGQDFNNTWLDDVCIYDLVLRAWVQRRDYPRHCGTYRSVAVSSNNTVRLPQEELRNAPPSAVLGGPPGQRFGPDTPALDPTPAESLIHLPYSAPPSDDYPSDIYLYSNYNFTDVKRELEVFSPLPDTGFAIHDKSSAMAGNTFPPGLRFPTGALLGTHLIIAGTYLAHSYQSFSIWVLDLLSMTWSRIDPGKAVESGSWFRGCLYAESNKFLIFGNKHGNLVDDYNRRLLSWDHVAVVDLEAFGIYQPPPLKIDVHMQELGLSALEEGVVADFEIVCEDGRKLSCSRKILEERWAWFAEEQQKFLANARKAAEGLPGSAMDVGLPDLPGAGAMTTTDPRLTPRSFHLSEPYPITLALLQYFYTTALVTPLQHAPAVLSQLLVLATNYQVKHLETLVKHAMHRALSNSTSVGVYEVATLCSCRSLQIRALKTVMSYTQKRPGRSKADRESGKPPGGAGGGGGGPPPSGGGNDGPGNDMPTQYVSRPRGTSDARFRMMGDGSGGGGAAQYNTRNGNSLHSNKPLPDHPAEDDELAPLPTLSTTAKTYRKNRHSIVSVRTEGEINALADFMSAAFTAGKGAPYSPIEEDPLDPDLFTTRKSAKVAQSSVNHSPPSQTYSLEPESHYSSDASGAYDQQQQQHLQIRQRLPRISTEFISGPTPSLTSVSTGQHTSPSPATPLHSISDLPSYDSHSFAERPSPVEHHSPSVQEDYFNHHQDPFTIQQVHHNYPQQHRVHPTSWPQKKSEVHWIATDLATAVRPPPPQEDAEDEIIIDDDMSLHPQYAYFPPPSAEPPVMRNRALTLDSARWASQLSLVPSNSSQPRTPPSTGFAVRFFKKEKPLMTEEQKEEKRRRKGEAKAKKEQMREQMRLEKAQRELLVLPGMMGGMSW